jgi:hypothetical protein
MPNHRKSQKEVVRFAIAALAAVAAWASPAGAQFPGGGPVPVLTVPGSTESDQPVEQSTNDIDTVQLPPIVQSLTQGGGGGAYTPNAQTIATLDQILFPGNGVNPQNFTAIFPGWTSCAPDCTDAGMASDQASMAVYQGALGVAQQQEQQLIGEGDVAGTIDNTVAQTTNVLTALQGIADLLAMQVQEQRYIRQQNDAIITLLATHYAQDLNDGMMSLATQVATAPGQQQ